jgi:hypothetical protein
MNVLLQRFASFFGLDADLRRVKKLVLKRRYRKYNNKILVEAWMNPSISLGLERFLPPLIDQLRAEPISFYGTYGGLATRLKEALRLRFSFYGHIGIRKFKLFSYSRKSGKYKQLARDLIGQNRSPEQFERLKYRNVLVGDAVYDSFLRGNNLPTIDFDHPDLLEKLANALYYIDSLYDYFLAEEVKAVCIIETTYMLALPGRVAFEFNIDVFIITHSRVFRLNKNEYIGFHEFLKFRSVYSSLPQTIKAWGTERAKLTMPSILARAGFELNSKISFNHFPQGHSYQLKKPLKLLVSAHDFFDSPHRVGYAFFSDFYIWLSFLNSVALKTNYKWYVRTHPNARHWNQEVINSIFRETPSVTLLSPLIRNAELVEMDFSAVLTVFGTVGSEWPLYGVPVINASARHKHVNIFGNITPKNKKEYIDLLHGLDSLEFYEENSQDSWSQYIFMRDFFMQKSLNTRLFEEICFESKMDLERLRRGFGWSFAHKVLSSEQYPSDMIKKGFENFMESKDYFLNRKHFGLEGEISNYGLFR